MHKPFAKRQLKLLGNRIRTLRHARGLSQEDLAALADIHVTYLSALECGKRNPSMAIFFSLSAALKVPPTELVQFGSCGAGGVDRSEASGTRRK